MENTIEKTANEIIEAIERITKDAKDRGCDDKYGISFQLDYFSFKNDWGYQNFFSLHCSRAGQEMFDVPRNKELEDAVWAKVEEKVKEHKWELKKTYSVFAPTFFISVL